MSNSKLAPISAFDASKFKKLGEEHHQGLFCHWLPLGVRMMILHQPSGWDAVLVDREGVLGGSIRGQNRNLDFWCNKVISAFRNTEIMMTICADDIARFSEEGVAIETVLHAASSPMESAVAGTIASWEPLNDPIYGPGEWPDLAITVLWALPMSSFDAGRDTQTIGIRMAHATAVFIKNQWNDPALVWPAIRMPVLMPPNPWIPGYGIGRPGRDADAVMAQGCYAMDIGKKTLVVDRETRWRANSNQIQEVTIYQAMSWAKNRLTEEL